MKAYLPAGEIVNTHGIRGAVRVLPWADSPDFLLDFSTVYLDGAPMAVESASVQKTCVLLKLRGVDSVEQAQALRGKIIEIARSDAVLPEGTFFIDDLLGMAVFDQTGAEIGKVRDVLQMPKHDVYVVRGEKEYLIPAVPAFIKKIDGKSRAITAEIIEGMTTDAD